MPDANGNFKGMAVPADAWQRIFAPKSTLIESTEAECCGVYGWCDKHDNQKRESASTTP